jgi:bacillithiol system protein YtxJ
MERIVMIKLESVEELHDLYQQEKPYLLFKNSTTCPVSSEAFGETNSFDESREDIPVYYLNVQELREGANDAADHFDIKHESPQAFLVNNKQVKWHDSHWRITKENLQKAADNL